MRTDYGALARDLLRAVSEARDQQTRFLASRGLEWADLLAMSAARRVAMQADYQIWRDSSESPSASKESL